MRRHIRLDGAAAASLLSPQAWDALRTGPSETSFSLPASRERFAFRCRESRLLARRAEAVCQLLAETDARGLTSYGVGAACLEWHVKRLRPALRLRLSDYAPETVTRLRAIFPESVDIALVDLLRDDLAADGDLVLLHRVDTEFTNQEWRRVLERLAAGGAGWILVIPTEFLGARNAAAELARRLRPGPRVFAGYLRSRPAFEAGWDGLYAVERELERDGVTLILLRLGES